MDRRTFMKLMGGLASMPIIGRIAKPLKSETVQEGIAAVSDKGMELYEMVVAKVIKEGKKLVSLVELIVTNILTDPTLQLM